MKYYFKITDVGKSIGYSIDFSEQYLQPCEQGHGRYIALEAKNEEDIKNKLSNLDFDSLTIVHNPTGA